MITSLGKKRAGYFAFLWFVVCTICHGFFALPLSVIGSLCSVSVASPGHSLNYLLYHYENTPIQIY